MLELLFSKTPKEEKKRQLEENADTIKPIYEVVNKALLIAPWKKFIRNYMDNT